MILKGYKANSIQLSYQNSLTRFQVSPRRKGEAASFQVHPWRKSVVCAPGESLKSNVCASEQQQSEGSPGLLLHLQPHHRVSRGSSLHGAQVTTEKDREENLRELACLCPPFISFSVLRGSKWSATGSPAFWSSHTYPLGDHLPLWGSLITPFHAKGGPFRMCGPEWEPHRKSGWPLTWESILSTWHPVQCWVF